MARATNTGWSLRRLRERVLSAGGRLIISARRMTLTLSTAAARFWAILWPKIMALQWAQIRRRAPHCRHHCLLTSPWAARTPARSPPQNAPNWPSALDLCRGLRRAAQLSPQGRAQFPRPPQIRRLKRPRRPRRRMRRAYSIPDLEPHVAVPQASRDDVTLNHQQSKTASRRHKAQVPPGQRAGSSVMDGITVGSSVGRYVRPSTQASTVLAHSCIMWRR